MFQSIGEYVIHYLNDVDPRQVACLRFGSEPHECICGHADVQKYSGNNIKRQFASSCLLQIAGQR